MKARRKSIARNLLRVVEIAIFFAISVLGYGLLAKTSSSGSKSRNRNPQAGIEKNLIFGGLQRELRELSTLVNPNTRPHTTYEAQKVLHVVTMPVATAHHVYPQRHLRLLSPELSRMPDTRSSSTPLLYNTFQQNPVLLI
ncbi:MAG: hypothetical protein LWW75_00955 [Chlorobiales bacterium]|nr:hypothetical protein [Chlorobiales bacterium]